LSTDGSSSSGTLDMSTAKRMWTVTLLYSHISSTSLSDNVLLDNSWRTLKWGGDVTSASSSFLT